MRPETPSADALFAVERPLDWSDDKTAMLVAACREMAGFHARSCPAIARLYRSKGFEPSSLTAEADLERIPALPAAAFKRFSLTSLPREEAVLEMSSSGTQGRPSRVSLDQGSSARLAASYRRMWEQLGLIDARPVNYALFSSDPEQVPDVALARGLSLWRGLAPAKDSFFAVRRDDGGRLTIDLANAYARLSDYARAPEPVRIIGLTAPLSDFLEHVARTGALTLPPGSWILTSGGWKGARREISRETLLEEALALLAVPARNVRDVYGSAELRVLFPECERHRFHVPAHSRVLVRDPENMRALPPGRPGLLQIVSPHNAMMPTLALLPGDIGALGADPCPCGLRSPTFSLLGRAETFDGYKGCALRLEEAVLS